MNQKARILVIDDEAIVRLTVESLLADRNLELLFAENGKQGLELARQFLPDAILLDIMMPDMDGYEVCRQIRAIPELAEVPIIIITALDSRASRLAGLDAGADDFLTKPFDTTEIQIRIQNILRLNRYRSLITERARFLWMVENSEDGYLILSARNTIQYANPRARFWLQLPDTYVNIGFLDQARLHYALEPAEGWEHWAEDPQPGYFVQAETSTARPFWLLVSAVDTPLGQDNHRVVRMQDITDKMAVDQDMRKFHTIVAHKLRTPVSLLYSSMTLLTEKMDAFDEKEIREMVKVAWKSSERLVNDVRAVLEYLDLPLSLQVGQPTSLETLPALIEEIAENRGITHLSISMPAPLAGRQIAMPPNALELIFHELLDNAHKFHPRQDPHVEIVFSPLEGERLRLSICDDGLTLTAKQLQWALMPYFQGEKHFTGEAPGMGLGLPTVASLVWQVGGKIRLTNRETGPGVQVELILPLRPEEEGTK
ncbi:MAG: hybrid sensor histidine kinase/response regulator [Anaerolineales bacterium]